MPRMLKYKMRRLVSSLRLELESRYLFFRLSISLVRSVHDIWTRRRHFDKPWMRWGLVCDNCLCLQRLHISCNRPYQKAQYPILLGCNDFVLCSFCGRISKKLRRQLESAPFKGEGGGIYTTWMSLLVFLPSFFLAFAFPCRSCRFVLLCYGWLCL